jgi:hypothetical protein
MFKNSFAESRRNIGNKREYTPSFISFQTCVAFFSFVSDTFIIALGGVLGKGGGVHPDYRAVTIELEEV